MTSFKKTIVLACAASLMGLGVAVAQTDPNMAAPAGDATPMATDPGAASTTAMPKKPMMKKHMAKKHMKKMKSM